MRPAKKPVLDVGELSSCKQMFQVANGSEKPKMDRHARKLHLRCLLDKEQATSDAVERRATQCKPGAGPRVWIRDGRRSAGCL